jgi:hypothetical protein
MLAFKVRLSEPQGLVFRIIEFKKKIKNLILIVLHLWKPSENNADKLQ